MQPNQPTNSAATTSSVWRSAGKWAYKAYTAWILFSLVSTSEAASPKNNFHASICKKPKVTTANKADVQVGSAEGKLVPQSCINKGVDSEVCLADISMFKQFKPDMPTFLKQREHADKATKKWLTEHNQKLEMVVQQLNGQEANVVNAIAADVALLAKLHNLAEAAKKYDIGACGEHKAIAIFDIIHRDLDKGTNTKIQSVSVVSDTKKHFIEDHGFLVLNSDLEDTLIRSNPKALGDHFAKAKSGMVCDPWNRAYEDIGTCSGLYKDAKAWDSVQVKTINVFQLVRDNYSRLPEVAQTFIADMFGYLNINVDRILATNGNSQKMEL